MERNRSKKSPKKGAKKPKPPKLWTNRMAPVALTLALGALCSLGWASEPIKPGKTTVGFGYGVIGDAGNFAESTSRADGYSGSFERAVKGGSVQLSARKHGDALTSYSVTYQPEKWGFYFPIGAVALDADGVQLQYGATAGVGMKFWANRLIGIRTQALYDYVKDDTLGGHDFIEASAEMLLAW